MIPFTNGSSGRNGRESFPVGLLSRHLPKRSLEGPKRLFLCPNRSLKFYCLTETVGVDDQTSSIVNFRQTNEHSGVWMLPESRLSEFFPCT